MGALECGGQGLNIHASKKVKSWQQRWSCKIYTFCWAFLRVLIWYCSDIRGVISVNYVFDLAKDSAFSPHCTLTSSLTHPAFRTAPVQLNDAAAVPVAFALYGDAMILSPSSSSEIAVVKLIRSSSLICKIIAEGWRGKKVQARKN